MNTIQEACTKLRLKPHLSFPEPLGGTLHRSFGLGLEGENLALGRIGGRTLQVGVGMREIKGRHEPYSRLSQRVCVGDGYKRILISQAWEEADGATERRTEALQAQ